MVEPFATVDLTTAFIVLTICISAVLTSKFALKPDSLSTRKKAEYEKYIQEQDKEIASLESYIKRMKQGPKITDEEANDPKEALLSLIPQLEHLVPAKLKPLLRDPKLVEFGLKLYDEHPEQFRNILSKFIGKSAEKLTATTPSGQAQAL